MMENEFYEDGFEQMLKEKADQFSMYPSRRVWHSIYNNLHPGRRWPSVVMSLLLVGALMLTGYLHNGENSITKQINNNSGQSSFFSNNEVIPAQQTIQPAGHINATSNSAPATKTITAYDNAFADVITNMADQFNYTVVKSNRPVSYATAAADDIDVKTVTAANTNNNANGHDIIQVVDAYIKTNQIFADIAARNRKIESDAGKTPAVDFLGKSSTENNTAGPTLLADAGKLADNTLNAANNKQNDKDVKATTTAATAKTNAADSKNEEKAWIENYALQNKAAAKKWKGKLGYQVYITPAVNYRKLTTDSKGSATPFANADINNSISQKPGFGFEAGAGINYLVAKRLQLKAGLQFNYTNYNIAANETDHPISTTIVLNDPSTGYSYSAARMTTTTNSFNSNPLQPVTLHNRTYQFSLPVGFAYRLSSKHNVDWYAGASVQPSYVFDGKAHIISSDLKNYVSARSSISPWNVNLGFETYMNFKLGSYNLQVGPQVRYQVNSTYKKDIALIEKPYAVGLKFGLTKGF